MKRVLLVTLLVVLAGCSSLPGPANDGDAPTSVTDEPSGAAGSPTTGTPGESSPTTEATPRDTAEEASTPRVVVRTDEASTATETPTPTLDVQSADNPWGKDTVTVALVEGGHEEIDYAKSLSGALDYWNANTQYGDYTVRFVAIDDVDEADVRVEIRNSVESCGVEHSDRVLGCAPLLVTRTAADPPETVTIEAGYNPESTEEIMIHEFGHVLGIQHGEEPEQYMQPNETVYRTAQPNVSERGYPWRTTEFRFYAATEDLPEHERDDAREQVEHAIEYYERVKDEDDDVPENVTVEWADNRSDANVVVEFPETTASGDSGVSQLGGVGPDLDGDGSIEYYANITVSLADIDTEAVGWHTGNWFGQALGLNESTLPAPFRSDDPRDWRDDWWTESP